jgi:antitoxin MazE
MRSVVRKMGNSSGIIIPKLLLSEIGMEVGDAVDLGIINGCLVIAPVRPHPRAGWAQDAKRIAEAKDNGLVLGEFGNEADQDLKW